MERVTGPMIAMTGREPNVGRAWKEGWPSKQRERSLPSAPRAMLYVIMVEAVYVVLVVQERFLMRCTSIVWAMVRGLILTGDIPFGWGTRNCGRGIEKGAPYLIIASCSIWGKFIMKLLVDEQHAG
jgi:hypothetical protein